MGLPRRDEAGASKDAIHACAADARPTYDLGYAQARFLNV
ncbi:hypothetical protein U91I_02782 [alpha proteobacterium U9-1i]|nr:hypothetical protein U91I_02782 [alpha proteobacterium U9-1i]